jgi:hypothetical protein
MALSHLERLRSQNSVVPGLSEQLKCNRFRKRCGLGFRTVNSGRLAFRPRLSVKKITYCEKWFGYSADDPLSSGPSRQKIWSEFGPSRSTCVLRGCWAFLFGLSAMALRSPKSPRPSKKGRARPTTSTASARAKFRMSGRLPSVCGGRNQVSAKPAGPCSNASRWPSPIRPAINAVGRSVEAGFGLGSAEARSVSNANIQAERVGGGASRHHRDYCPKRLDGATRSRRYSRNTCCMDCPLPGLRNRGSEREPLLLPWWALLLPSRKPRPR